MELRHFSVLNLSVVNVVKSGLGIRKNHLYLGDCMKVGDKVKFKDGRIGTIESMSSNWNPPIFHVRLDGTNLYAWVVDENNPNKTAIERNFAIGRVLDGEFIFR